MSYGLKKKEIADVVRAIRPLWQALSEYYENDPDNAARIARVQRIAVELPPADFAAFYARNVPGWTSVAA